MLHFLLYDYKLANNGKYTYTYIYYILNTYYRINIYHIYFTYSIFHFN